MVGVNLKKLRRFLRGTGHRLNCQQTKFEVQNLCGRISTKKLKYSRGYGNRTKRHSCCINADAVCDATNVLYLGFETLAITLWHRVAAGGQSRSLQSSPHLCYTAKTRTLATRVALKSCTHTHLLHAHFCGVHTLRVHFAHSHACCTHAWL